MSVNNEELSKSKETNIEKIDDKKIKEITKEILEMYRNAFERLAK